MGNSDVPRVAQLAPLLLLMMGLSVFSSLLRSKRLRRWWKKRKRGKKAARARPKERRASRPEDEGAEPRRTPEERATAEASGRELPSRRIPLPSQATIYYRGSDGLLHPLPLPATRDPGTPGTNRGNGAEDQDPPREQEQVPGDVHPPPGGAPATAAAKRVRFQEDPACSDRDTQSCCKESELETSAERARLEERRASRPEDEGAEPRRTPEERTKASGRERPSPRASPASSTWAALVPGSPSGPLRRCLERGEYGELRGCLLFESDFAQVTRGGEVANRVTMAVAATSPLLPVPDLLLLARTASPASPDAEDLQLTQMLPLSCVRLSAHKPERHQLRVQLVTGRSFCLQLLAPPRHLHHLFVCWLRLLFLLGAQDERGESPAGGTESFSARR